MVKVLREEWQKVKHRGNGPALRDGQEALVLKGRDERIWEDFTEGGMGAVHTVM